MVQITCLPLPVVYLPVWKAERLLMQVQVRDPLHLLAEEPSRHRSLPVLEQLALQGQVLLQEQGPVQQVLHLPFCYKH